MYDMVPDRRHKTVPTRTMAGTTAANPSLLRRRGWAAFVFIGSLANLVVAGAPVSGNAEASLASRARCV